MASTFLAVVALGARAVVCEGGQGLIRRHIHSTEVSNQRPDSTGCVAAADYGHRGGSKPGRVEDYIQPMRLVDMPRYWDTIVTLSENDVDWSIQFEIMTATSPVDAGRIM